MALSKDEYTTVDNVTKDGMFSVKTVTRYFDGDMMVAESVHRTTLAPGDDVTQHPEQVQAVARGLWTPEAVAKWSAQQQETIAAEVAKHEEMRAQLEEAVAKVEAAREELAVAAAAVEEARATTSRAALTASAAISDESAPS